MAVRLYYLKVLKTNWKSVSANFPRGNSLYAHIFIYMRTYCIRVPVRIIATDNT